MLFLPIITATFFSSLAIAMPTTLKRQTFESVEVAFNGAAGASYNLFVVTNSVIVPTNNDLSVTSISMFGRADFVCTAFGVDGSVTELVADEVRNYWLI